MCERLRVRKREHMTNIQANKSTGRMPWHQEPMKDVVSCDKLWGVANRRYIHRFPNGETRQKCQHTVNT